jgi:hypothetical protein
MSYVMPSYIIHILPGLQKLQLMPNIIRMIMSRKRRWAGHVARIGENLHAYRILMGKP